MDNFTETAKRCNRSSQLLKNNGENFNSCYLAGYVLECYVKLVCKIGYNSPIREFYMKIGHDVRKFQDEFEMISTNLSDFSDVKSQYLIDLQVKCPTMISGQAKWNPFKRYDDSGIWDAQHIAENYEIERNMIISKIIDMELDGVI